MHSKRNYTKYLAILFGAIFLVAAAFLGLAVWERHQAAPAGQELPMDVITYQGKEYVPNEQVETFLIIGLDRFADSSVSASHGTGVQADFLMLLAFNNETKTCDAVQINRDSMTKVNKLAVGGTSVVGTYDAQVALAYNYVNDDNDKIRCRNTIDAVEALLEGVHVDHYFALTMDAVGASNDVVGGVEVTVLDDFTGIDDTLVKGQTVTLSAEQALRYVRTRYGMEDSSNSARMARQQQYINAWHDQVTQKINADENFLLELVDTMDDHVVYDSSDRKLLKFAEEYNNYEFLGIRELEGQSRVGDEFVEYHVNKDAALETVIELFYVPKN